MIPILAWNYPSMQKTDFAKPLPREKKAVSFEQIKQKYS